MLALAGYPLGLGFRFFDPEPGAPAGELAEVIAVSLEDPAAIEQHAADLGAITFEAEHVPMATLQALTGLTRVFPPPRTLEAAQDRLLEKEFFTRLGVPTPPYAAVNSRDELDAAVARIGLPAHLKTRRHGPSGKERFPLREPIDVALAWTEMGAEPLILEGHVPFERELCLVAARNPQGETAVYPLTENYRNEGLLTHTRALSPGPASPQQAEAEAYMLRVMSAMRYVGVVTIEFFQYLGRLIANSMVPRVHASAHWTIEGAETSQFENHLRAGLGRPLGSPAPTGYCGVVNLIGETPDLTPILRVRGAHLHLYGTQPQPGEILGHVTIRANDPKSLGARMAHLGQILKRQLP
jgi:5-(carboxyamino)imidazole ribonucleotide synthase